MPNLLLENIDN